MAVAGVLEHITIWVGSKILAARLPNHHENIDIKRQGLLFGVLVSKAKNLPDRTHRGATQYRITNSCQSPKGVIKTHEMKKLIIRWLFKKPIRKYILKNLSQKDEDFTGYLYDLLIKDEQRMVGHKDALIGYWDLDIEMNRVLQKELRQYVNEGD